MDELTPEKLALMRKSMDVLLKIISEEFKRLQYSNHEAFTIMTGVICDVILHISSDDKEAVFLIDRLNFALKSMIKLKAGE
ncbi:hypothetical protein UFOVP1357_47 [uncultured Caudovirales phage]|uniref:Uncharacterized protein n=1 Tax=uncultured Caudovirales phage TaxID=2100421 RepID=A0A6J5LGM0_9CAUD|nr:hypothetical protein UFOVP18_25 [uncultured Caudovirales phage]CAB4126828.1 hypothetical protein UFOVP82_27 [uncultured Caudovirales phage]CAB4132433.1 hypothetical protein UFOVP258_18 [uncultured Caudovirales phage]CAB4146331.1 hypothetical protein UFOVP502_10 [uncultured Caudovirales phage]CAB4200466.1 hypothetical protein UFOVP1357_47 [uncultured Caudovirales phage]